MTMPEHLKEVIEREAKRVCNNPEFDIEDKKVSAILLDNRIWGFENGAEALYYELLKAAPEFDGGAAYRASFENIDWNGEHNGFEAGALWHHNYTKAQLAARDADFHLRSIGLTAKHLAEFAQIKSELSQKDTELDQVRTEEKGMALTAARIQIAQLKSELSALMVDRDQWKRNAEKKANYINKLLDINLKLESALNSLRHGLVGHRGNGELLPEIDEALAGKKDGET